MKDKLPWTKDKPTEEGFYVWKPRHGGIPYERLAEVKYQKHMLFISIVEGDWKMRKNISDRLWLKVG